MAETTRGLYVRLGSGWGWRRSWAENAWHGARAAAKAAVSMTTAEVGLGGAPRAYSDARTAKISFDVRGQRGTIPAIGLGTVGIRSPAPCRAALGMGYRMLDTALSYGNHKFVGNALNYSCVDREDVFVTTKVSFCPVIQGEIESNGDDKTKGVWMYDPVNTKGNESEAIDLCLEQLGVDYVDLLLVHNPTTSLEEYGSACLPHFFELFRHQGDPQAIRPDRLPDGKRLRDLVCSAKLEELVRTCNKEKSLAIRKRTWAALEGALRDGKCKFIGVSNYPSPLLEEMESYAEVMPAVNQVECTPWFSREGLRATAKRLGVVLTAYGTGNSLAIRRKDRTVNGIAKKLGKTPIQVLLRWNYQHGIVSVPRSMSADHIRENAHIFDWALSEEDMAALDALDEDYPLYWDPKPTLATFANESED